MSARALEAFLARLYTDERLRLAFLARRETVALEAGLDGQAAQALAQIDREGLLLAVESFARKRAEHAGKRRSPWVRRS